jgi:putative transposase
MNQVYRYSSYSKQAFHQKMDRLLLDREQDVLLLPIIAELRQEHPGVAARQLYEILKPEGIGRDKFERLCFENGYKLSRKRTFSRTTDSTGVIRFPNLVLGMELTYVNQVWVSDITYFEINKKFYYLTFIMDLFSRVIVGYSVSKRLLTSETTLPALREAIKSRSPAQGLIFHSDGGGQYYCKDFLKLTSDKQIKNSMCDMAYENPNAERINGTIKNQYLKGYNPQSFPQLVQMTERAVRNYNTIRPHKSLKKLTPAAFEKGPAGGSSLGNDNFCDASNPGYLHQKNHHSPKRLTNQKKGLNGLEKTVNVF